jgi:integrase
MEFTKASIARLTMPAGKDEYIAWDDDLPGFGIRLRGDSRRWIVQYRVGHRQRRESLGDPRKVKLDDARKIARERFARVELGGDPAAEKARVHAQARLTLGYVADRYLAHKEGKVRSGTYDQIKLHMTVHWKPLRNRPLDSIELRDVAARLGELAKEHGRVSASRARSNLSGLFAWAVGEGLTRFNPCIGSNDPGAGISSRERVLSDDELRVIWHACEDADDYDWTKVYGRIVRLVMLTGCRREEIGGLRRTEIADTVMTIPGTRTKNHRTLVLGLAPIALDVLASVPRREDLFFSGRKGKAYACWGYDKARLDARIAKDTGKALAPWTLHDLRRSVRTGMGRLGVPPHIAELVINHVKDGIQAVYDKHTYQREIDAALARWADHVLAVVGGNIVPMKAA